jgi:hypothetical protein
MKFFQTVIFFLLGAVGFAQSSKIYNTRHAASQKLVKYLDEHFLKLADDYTEGRGLKSTIPERIKKGQNGYVIITTEAIKRGSQVLPKFVKHKKRLGFRPIIITEKEFGGGIGPDAAKNIRKWLQENHKALNLLYCLFIGNPHPDSGDIPMMKVGKLLNNVKADIDYYKKTFGIVPKADPSGKYLLHTGKYPTDYYFADLSGDWDHDDNTSFAEKADYREGGIDGHWEVLVGRIPYYGEESAYGKLEDTDAILERTINYELEPNPTWRKNLFYVGGADTRFRELRTKFFEKNGAAFTFYRESTGDGYEPDQTRWKGGQVATGYNTGCYGVVNFQEHGSPKGMAGMINNAGARNLSPKYPSHFYLGGCDVARPEFSENVCYALLRGAGIGVRGGTRSVTGLAGCSTAKSTICYERLYFGMSQGEAHWDRLSELMKPEPGDKSGRRRAIGMTNFLMTLYGDPSVVVMPSIEFSKLIVSPNREQITFKHQYRSAGAIEQVYHIRNLSRATQNYKISVDRYLGASSKAFSLSPGKAKEVKIRINRPEILPIGLTQAKWRIATNGKSRVLKFNVNTTGASSLRYISFDTVAERRNMLVCRGKSAEEAEQFYGALEGDYQRDYAEMIRDCNTRYHFPSPGTGSMTLGFKFKYDRVTDVNLQKKPVKIMQAGKFVTSFTAIVTNEILTVTLSTMADQYSGEATRCEQQIPGIAPEQWHKIIVLMDRHSNKMTIFINDQKFEKELNFKPTQGLDMRIAKHGVGSKHTTIYMDEIYYANYAQSGSELELLKRDMQLFLATPTTGSQVFPEGVNLAWKAPTHTSTNTEYAVLLSKTPSFKKVIEQIKTTDSHLVLPKLSDHTTYFWKVGRLVGKKYIYSQGINSFTTNSKIEPFRASVRVMSRKLATAEVGNNMFEDTLAKFVKAEDKNAQYHFAKVSGPGWLRVSPDGSLFTPFGPSKGSEGVNKFKAAVIPEHGKSIEFEFEITVTK